MERINYPGPLQDYKVLVQCYTYNQSKYIKSALNGFAMQQTNFPFVCFVMDDASTDGEPEVIRQWIEQECDMNTAQRYDIPTSQVIIVTHKANKNCTFAVYLLKENLYRQADRKRAHIKPWIERCDYIAWCEGDDYWINPMKLQKQVDFLEQNPEYTMCFHNAFVYREEIPDVSLFNLMKNDQDLTIHDAIHEWVVPTASIVFRSCVILNYPRWMPRIYSGDYSLILLARYLGKVRYHANISSVYRLSYSTGSMSALMKKRGIFVIEQHLLLLKAYNKGTDYIFKKELNSRIKVLEKELRFQKAMKNKDIYGLLLSADLIIRKSLNRLGIKKR